MVISFATNKIKEERSETRERKREGGGVERKRKRYREGGNKNLVIVLRYFKKTDTLKVFM